MIEVYYDYIHDKIILTETRGRFVAISEDGTSWFMFEGIGIDLKYIGEL